MAKAKKRQAARKPRTTERELTIEEAYSEFHGEIETLGEEMRAWYDNMPEGPQNGEKGSAVDEAAEALEGIDERDIPEALKPLKFKFSVMSGRGNSRAKRRDDAVQVLDALMQFVEAIDEDMLLKQEARRDYIKALNLPELGTNECGALQEAAAGLHSELEEDKDAAEGVEFPGQFG
jgi:hypothetical protein